MGGIILIFDKRPDDEAKTAAAIGRHRRDAAVLLAPREFTPII